ncbi:hypothetical protein [Kineococcus sp. SYSU DK004]|uniref:hypothetical protein n=1 Tax=Kineococcus sp. SYSU DK004 TaxID=3383125 RepID=UPI003D7D263F
MNPPDGPLGERSARELWRDDDPAPVLLAAAGWRLHLVGDQLEELTHEGRAVLRAVRFVVRDRDWATVPADVQLLWVQHHRDGLDVTVRARARGAEVDLSWEARVRVDPDGVRVSAEARALAPSWCNRVGLVLLHHPDLAGTGLLVRHPDGTSTSTRFPRDIAPHQPARDIAGLRWSAPAGVVRADLRGDVFEVEDQRNWTDASFKTYSTPLERPFPVHLPAGSTVRQELSLQVDAPAPGTTPSGPAPAAAAPAAAGPVDVDLAPSTAPHPEVGTGASTAPQPADRTPSPPWTGALPVLVELDLDGTGWRSALDRARRDAAGAALDVRLVTDDAGTLPDAVAALHGLPVRRVAVFSATTHLSEPALWRALADEVRRTGLDAQVLAGTRAHFTELNRGHHRLPEQAAAWTFSTTPQMHDRGRAQVLESLAVQRLVAERAVRLAGGRPVHVGPITLAPRFNAVATTPRRPQAHGDLSAGYGAEHVPGATDPRQRSRGFAAWLVASAAALGVPGVASLSFAEAWGPRGLGTAEGEPYPAAAAVGHLAALAGRPRWDVAGPVPAGAAVLAAGPADGSGGDGTVLAANTTGATVHLRLRAPGGFGAGRLRPAHVPAGEPATALPAPPGDTLLLPLAPGAVLVWTGPLPGPTR